MKDYIFVHINKCGGTAIKRALGSTNKYQKYKHERISDTKRRMSKRGFERAFKFAFIRNPWDRIASMYFYRKNNLKRVKLQDMDFREWFYKAFTTDFTAVPLMNESCWSYISIDDKLAVDFVGRFENMSRDWDRLCGLLGVDVRLQTANRTIGKEDVSYSEDMKRIVEEKFQKDLSFYERSVPT